MSRLFPGLLEGRIVHYCYTRADSPAGAGECRPALVVRVWRYAPDSTQSRGYVNLAVFSDGINDHVGPPDAPLITRAASRFYRKPIRSIGLDMTDLGPLSGDHEYVDVAGFFVETGTWHWPHECPHAQED